MKVFIIAALTADGLLGRDDHDFPDWTSPADTKFFVAKTKEAGTIVMGSKTYQTAKDYGRLIPNRRKIIYTSQPAKFADDDVETTAEPAAELVARLATEGAAGLAVCGGASIYTQFLQAGVVDELFLTIEPQLFGRGISLLDQSLDVELELIESSQLSPNVVLLHYHVAKN